MKANVFIVADNYSDNGYEIKVLLENETWRYTHYMESETAFFLQEINLHDPKASELVQIGLNKTECMKQSLTEHIAHANEQIKEYESKFMMLDSPDKEELS